MRLVTALKIVGVLVVALVATAVAILFNIDLGAYKGEIAAAVKQATGRDLVIDGELHPTIGLTPAIAVDHVRFANASWGSRKDMARIKRFRAEVALLPILTGEIRIKRVVLVGADILLETGKDGAGNWIMQPGGKAAAQAHTGASGAIPIPTVNLVSIEDSKLAFRDDRTGKTRTFAVDRLQVSAHSADAPLAIRFRGSYNDTPLTVKGTVGSLVRVMSGAEPLAFHFDVAAGGAAIGIKGRIAKPLEGKGIEIALSASGKDIAALGPLAGSTLPSLGPYRFAAMASDGGAAWAVRNISLTIGQSSVLGEATVNPTARPIAVTANLTSPLLRLADFGDASRPAPASGAPARGTGDGRVFPADPIPLGMLKTINAQMAFRATRIEAPMAVLTDVAVDLVLKDGRLTVKPARFNVAGGAVATELTLDAAKAEPSLTARLDALRLDLAAVVKDAGHPGLVTGRVDLGGAVSGHGNSVRALMAGLDGKLGVTMKDGRLENSLLDKLSADVLKEIFGTHEKGIGINCLVGRYDIKHGQLKSLATLFDTTRATVRGSGGANLADETLDFSLVPQAKEISVVSLLVPVRITGRFSSPSVGPDAERMAAGAIGVVTGAVATGGVSIIGSVIGGIVGNQLGGPASTAENNPCLAALTGQTPGGASATQSRPTAPKGPVEGVGKAIKGIGEGIGKGIKGLFGQ